MTKKLLFLLLSLSLFAPAELQADISAEEFGGIIYVGKSTVAELENLFKTRGYTRFHNLKNNAYPAIFVKTLPTDFQEIKKAKYRNELFIRILAPLAFKINEELSNERQTLLRLERNFQKNHTLSETQIQKLEELSLKYDVFTRLKNNDRTAFQIQALKRRIDTIPPSILIAVAAMESNWGSSRIAKEANSLYKKKIWFTNEGLEPTENKDDGYRFKIYESLIDSMRDFALDFNSGINYENAWQARSEASKRHGVVIGESIAYALSISSNLPNFAGILDYTTAFYDFMSIDTGHLQRSTPNNVR